MHVVLLGCLPIHVQHQVSWVHTALQLCISKRPTNCTVISFTPPGLDLRTSSVVVYASGYLWVYGTLPKESGAFKLKAVYFLGRKGVLAHSNAIV